MKGLQYIPCATCSCSVKMYARSTHESRDSQITVKNKNMNANRMPLLLFTRCYNFNLSTSFVSQVQPCRNNIEDQCFNSIQNICLLRILQSCPSCVYCT